jgi:hypothetical protein
MAGGVRLRELRADVDGFRVASSNLVRISALGGLGAVWAFSSGFFLAAKDAARPSAWLLAAGVAFAAALLGDVLQIYVRATWMGWIYARRESTSKVNDVPDLDAEVAPWSTALRRTTGVLWHLKTLLLLVGFVLFAIALVRITWWG